MIHEYLTYDQVGELSTKVNSRNQKHDDIRRIFNTLMDDSDLVMIPDKPSDMFLIIAAENAPNVWGKPKCITVDLEHSRQNIWNSITPWDLLQYTDETMVNGVELSAYKIEVNELFGDMKNSVPEWAASVQRTPMAQVVVTCRKNLTTFLRDVSENHTYKPAAFKQLLESYATEHNIPL